MPPRFRGRSTLLGEVAVWRATPASTPKTADQPEQDNYKRRPPFGNRISTEASDAATTTSVLTSQSAALLKALVIAGTKIDSTCPNHARPARTPHPAPAYKSAPQSQWCGTS